MGGAISTFGQVQARTANARALSAEADSVEQASAFDERQYRRQATLVQGTADAQGAASGVQVSSGTSLFHELDRVKQGEIEALNIRRTGAVKAQGLRYGARMERRKIPFDIISGATNAASGAIQSSILYNLMPTSKTITPTAMRNKNYPRLPRTR